MQLTVNEARTFGGLKECRLLAGEKGLNRVIRCVDSMEIPDISQWLQRGEFLVTTGYALKDNSEALVQVVEALAEKEGSGLALKLDLSEKSLGEYWNGQKNWKFLFLKCR